MRNAVTIVYIINSEIAIEEFTRWSLTKSQLKLYLLGVNIPGAALGS